MIPGIFLENKYLEKSQGRFGNNSRIVRLRLLFENIDDIVKMEALELKILLVTKSAAKI